MIGNDVLRWALTALLLAASLYVAFRAGRKSPPATRVGSSLHAAMLAAMAYMLAAMDVHSAGATLAGPSAAGMPGRRRA
ncbi:DUF5134 domain-containing protein [Pseudarthrobacter sp. PvP090]|uniref:DUF5134 domain-containing protein n=1 Tax=Pseudarthrobacter sp. PvP090 TaxID=3156393 RepID=UPI0033929A44